LNFISTTTTLGKMFLARLTSGLTMNLIITCLFMLASMNVFAADFAAQVTSIQGKAWVQKVNEAPRPLYKGDSVFAEERIDTDTNSRLNLLFTDGSKFDLGEQTTLEITDYSYSNVQHKDSFITHIFKGTFRFFTGLIVNGDPSSMEVKLPVATIGIRGTHVVGEVTATTAKVVLLKPEKPNPSTSVEVYNQFGSVTIDKSGYGTEVPDEFSPPSPVRRMQMRTIDNLIRSIQNTQRIRIPRPR